MTTVADLGVTEENKRIIKLVKSLTKEDVESLKEFGVMIDWHLKSVEYRKRHINNL